MTPYLKVSGGGNDFLALVEPEQEPRAEEIRAWCRRGLSLGADGLFVLRRAAAPNEIGEVVMDYWNADGLPATLCLNGTRCAARLAFELGWARDEARVRTGAGPIAARRVDATQVALVLPRPAAPERRELEVAGERHAAWLVEVGVPHLVLVWTAGLASAPVATLGPLLRRHPDLGSAGANVDFVRFPTRRELEIRTFERGVEAETLACGTGVLAGAATGLALGLGELPLSALTRGGFRMAVRDETPDGGPAAWGLAGDARILARGELTPEAAIAPPAPVW
jgi:diaminopimelate epimerase